MIGMFHDRRLLQGLVNSFFVGVIVSALSVVVGTCNAFLFERRRLSGSRARSTCS